ncbi:MAG: RNA polymerase sigma-70 factor [Prevotella sp.]|nr:RNA polymerase sigma-70 factor [Prevotella sp.]MDY4039783.1 RNA polymerase sigma-70 factor [Prevotella sp.]
MVNDRPSEERRQIENCFTANYQALCYFADSLLHDVEVSEDIVQDVFCKVIGSGRQFESEGHMRSYLYIAVRNSCINLLRSGRLQHVGLDSASLSASETLDEDADYEMVRAEIIRKISAAIDTLPPRYREVFELAYVKNARNEEIAEQMHISPNTVRVMKQRAKKQLRALLQDLYPLLFLVVKNLI